MRQMADVDAPVHKFHLHSEVHHEGHFFLFKCINMRAYQFNTTSKSPKEITHKVSLIHDIDNKHPVMFVSHAKTS